MIHLWCMSCKKLVKAELFNWSNCSVCRSPFVRYPTKQELQKAADEYKLLTGKYCEGSKSGQTAGD